MPFGLQRGLGTAAPEAVLHDLHLQAGTQWLALLTAVRDAEVLVRDLEKHQHGPADLVGSTLGGRAMTGFEALIPKLVAALGAAASPIVKAALEAAIARLRSADEERASDATRAIALLETANQLMGALEAETDQILLTAMSLPDPDEPRIRRTLLTRLNNLLHGEVIRPALNEVRAALVVVTEKLRKDARRFFGRVQPDEDVAAALGALDEATDYISRYLDWLGDQTPETYQTAPYLAEMVGLQNMLTTREVDDAVIAEAAGVVIRGRYPVAIKRSEHIGRAVEQIRTGLL